MEVQSPTETLNDGALPLIESSEMMDLKNTFGKKLTVTAVIITAALAVFTIIFGNNNFLVSGVRTIFSPFLSLTSRAAHEIKDMQSYFTELKSYKEENTRLAEENADLKRSGLSVAEYKAENDRLKELLELQDEMEGRFRTTAALVVSYEPNNWFDTIVINKGKWSGISVGDAVVASGGIVGKITEVGAGYSVISTMLNSENSIGVRIVRNGELAVVEGDAELSKNKLCRMSFIEKAGGVNLGDLVETTGSGGVYPSGINVGTVKEIKAENSVQYAVIEPAVNVSELYEVLVISGGDE
ncbi:MAG: rod shape-determining protein MreC [Clostridia bacterium]|nr:rod shape-determining protein MreC [Clostridia bacterium]